MRLRLSFALLATLAGTAGAGVVYAQTPNPGLAQTTVKLSPKLLPDAFGSFKRAGSPAASESAPISLSALSKDALEEFNPQRSDVAHYIAEGSGNPHNLTVETIEFADATGAYGAFTLARRPEMKDGRDLGFNSAYGSGAALWTSGTALVLAYPATPADLPTLKTMDALLPKASGNKTLRPLLPTLLPERGFQPGTIKYALGPHSYQAEGGVLPSANLGWNKAAESITARYADRRGNEILSIFLYPTPAIAGAMSRQVEGLLPGLGPSFKVAKVRREGQLVILANGSFSPDAAQNMVENVHLKQLLTTDRSMPTPDEIVTHKTYSTFAQVILFAGLLGLSAMLLGIFLGGGRALLRVMRGKSASTEAEFLSLHLDPQNTKIHLPTTE